MFTSVCSFAIHGVDAMPVWVEVDVGPGLPAFEVVGLPDAAVREARERVRAAVKNSGLTYPPQRIVVNLAPAHTRKGGAGFDLPIALGILAASAQLPPERLQGLAFVGELALDGTVRPVAGALAHALAAAANGCRGIVTAVEVAPEAALSGLPTYAIATLAEATEWLRGGEAPAQAVPGRHPAPAAGPDLADVKGQLIARRALEVAAAGGHNLLMIGPPGAGKTLLARCLPSILPPLQPDEALEVSRIHSVAGLLAGRLLRSRPYRAPHHCASRSAILGGGSPLRPGEITLAHRGVLFLDELPEFARAVLEGLRQPLEEGRVLLSRAQGHAVFPASPMLVAAANPCPCGYLGDSGRACTCPSAAVNLYRSRLSGPLLDRFDLQLFLAPVPYEEFAAAGAQGAAEPSSRVRERVVRARNWQATRLGGATAACNAEMSLQQVRRYCRLPAGGEQLMRQAMERLGLSLRGHDRILKVARTIADLAGCEQIQLTHLAEAIQYRGLDRQQ